jgi:hypothetical protein
MGRFYQALLAGQTLGAAARAGRAQLYAGARRRSALGPLELRDWLVPALYQQADDYCPVTPTRLATIPAPLAEPQEPACPQGRYGFIGRDAELLRLERALRDDEAPWALLSGMAGVGKTELAHGFGRWLYETGGCPGGVFRTSFREHANLAQVLGEAMAHDADFPALAPEVQFDRAVQYLRATPCLLIWDEVEAVAG